MPKVTKTNKVDARSAASPMKGKKDKKPTVIVSKVSDLPVVKVEDDAKMEELKSLTVFKDNSSGQAVTFDAVFVRQNQFGAMEFNITETEYNDLMKVFTDDLYFEGTVKCMKADDFSGHFQISGKLSKEYKSQFESESLVPIPKGKTMVRVEGELKTNKIRGNMCCYLQINNWSALA